VDFDSLRTGDDQPDTTPGGDADHDVPTSLEVLPDGGEAVVIGDVHGHAGYNHHQGENSLGYLGDCGLVSCGDVLNQFGVEVSEDDVVRHAAAVGECATDGDPADAGGTTFGDQVQVLADYGIPAHTEQDDSLEDLAGEVEQGHGVIVAANSGVLWDDPNNYENGQANHAVTVTGVARDPNTGQLAGFYVNDSGTGQSARFVDTDTMTAAWLSAGGNTVVTDVVHTGGTA
jgi:hypothetical protein